MFYISMLKLRTVTNMLKVRTFTTKSARLPYDLIKGNVAHRNKLAQKFSDNFSKEINECSKIEYCTAGEFRASLDKVLGENKIKYSLNTVGIAKGAAASLGREVTAKDNSPKNIDLFVKGFKFYFPNEGNNEKYINKEYAVHEARHFFDHLTQPKYNNFRYTGFENPQIAEISQKISDKFLFKSGYKKLKVLEKETKEDLKQLPNEKIIDTLQTTKLNLLSEINAYNDELKYLKKNPIKNMYKIIKLKSLMDIVLMFDKKVKMVDKLLLENMQEIRSKATRK